MSNKVINKKILEALVFSGSLSSLENNQNFFVKKYRETSQFKCKFHKNYEKNQVSLFDNFFDDKDFDSSNFDECSYNEKLSWNMIPLVFIYLNILPNFIKV